MQTVTINLCHGVMAGLVPGIHAGTLRSASGVTRELSPAEHIFQNARSPIGVDGPDEPGHDGRTPCVFLESRP